MNNNRLIVVTERRREENKEENGKVMSDVVEPIGLSCLLEAYTPTAQIIVAFALGVLLSPWTATFVAKISEL